MLVLYKLMLEEVMIMLLWGIGTHTDTQMENNGISYKVVMETIQFKILYIIEGIKG